MPQPDSSPPQGRSPNLFVARSRTFAAVAGLLSIALGVLVLVGWQFGIESLMRVGGPLNMKANAALNFVLCGLALVMLRFGGDSPIGRIGQVLAGGMALVAGTTLSQHLFGWNAGIDELLFRETPGEAATVSPGRMGPPASTSFLLLGLAMLLITSRTTLAVAQLLAVATLVWALVALTGYSYGAEALYGYAPITAIAFHTAIGLLTLGLGMLALRADEGIVAAFSSDTEAGILARRALFVVVVLPLALGAVVTALERERVLDFAFGTAAVVVGTIVLVSLVIGRNAVRLDVVSRQRRVAEEAVAHQQARLHHAYDRFALAEAASNGFVYDWDVATGRVERSAGFTGLLEYPHDEVDATASWWLAIIHPDDRSVFDFSDGVQGGWSTEYRVRHHDGRWLHVWDRGREFRAADGTVTRIIGSVVDISERVRLEQEREVLLRQEREARLAAEEAARLKDEFLATVSHELRTPLTAILGWTTLLQIDDDPEMCATALETIERNARIQAELVDDILDVSRVVSGRLRLNRTRVPLAQVIDAAIDTVRPAADARHIRIVTSGLDAQAIVIGDRDRLQQVVWNLLSNAVKFSPAEGEVRVELSTGGERARVVVGDDGCGIDPDFLPFVFERFRQADGSRTRRHGGLGLGLAIARHLTELHGGAISAESAGPGQGASFTVELPVASVQPASESSPDGNGAGAARPVRLDGVHVLAVDDQADARDVIKGILEHHGATVTLASSADDAVAMLHACSPTVLLCDIGMPEKDGYAFLRAARSVSGSRRPIPAIALTGYAQPEERARAGAEGFDDFLPKPVDAGALVASIAAVIPPTRDAAGEHA